jgi:hypothetical protein
MNATQAMITNTGNRHMLIFRDTAEVYEKMSPEDKQNLLRQWTSWYDSLESQGKLEGGRPLEPRGRIVSHSEGRVTDGPYVESKEAVGGFFMLTVDTIEEATEIAKGCPSLKYGLVVEVRPVAECCPQLSVKEPLFAEASA